MIYLCLGMTKSASTLVYQLTEEILRQAGRRPLVLPPPLQPLTATTNYFDTVDAALLAAVHEVAGSRDVVLKTHQQPAPEVIRMIVEGALLASYAIRDPREMALSMVDHGTRARRWRDRPFAECTSIAECMPSIDHQLANFAAVRACTGLLILPYNETAFATERVIERIARQIAVPVDAAKVARVFASGRLVQQFSKGTPLRHREMDAETSACFLDRYADFYRTVDLAEGAAGAAATHRASRWRTGQLHQELINLRRWFRGRLGLRL